MRIGFLGLGRIGTSHVSVVHEHPEVTGLVLADAVPGRAADAAARLGCESVAEVREIFSAGIDAVVVATATSSHEELLLAGVDAGLPVFCEKPVATDLQGTLRVVERVRASDVPVQIGFQRRFDAGYGAARAALRDGRIGDLHRVHMVTADAAPPAADYIPTSGGLFRDCHIHDFDVLRWVTGREVVDVLAVGSNRGASFFAAAGDVDNSAGLLTLDDGTLVTFHGARYNGGGHDVRMELAGTKATYAVGLDERSALTSAEPGVEFPGGAPYPTFWERFRPAYVAEINAFLELVLNGGPSPCTVEDALAALYVAEAAEISRREGRRVEVAEVAK